MNRYDCADEKALRIDRAKARRHKRISFENICILGNVDKLRFRRYVAVTADDRSNTRFRTLDDSANTRSRIRHELNPRRMGIGVADKADYTFRRNDSHIFLNAFFTAYVDDQRISPRAIVTGNYRCSTDVKLAVRRLEIEHFPIAFIFCSNFIIIDTLFLEGRIFLFQRFPFDAVLEAYIDDMEIGRQRIEDATGSVFKGRYDHL